ncbi:MAG: hypothetical protein AAGC55_25145 [Myxococcota bacterium]
MPIAALRSLYGLDDKRSWQMRTSYAARAPKVVLRTIDGMTQPRAHALRATHARSVKEALDSMVGLDDAPSWALRAECLDIWPSTVVKSLGDLGLSERGRSLALRALARYPDNISLLKHMARLTDTEPCGPAQPRQSASASPPAALAPAGDRGDHHAS